MAAFAKDKRRPGGVEASCKACKSIKDAKYRAEDKSGKVVAVDTLKAQWEWEPVELTGKRRFGIMLRDLFPNEVIIEDLEIAGHTVDFFLRFANIVINHDPVSGDDTRMAEVRAEIMRRIVVGEEVYEGEADEEYGVCENPGLEGKDITSLVEVTPEREIDAIRRIIIAIAEDLGSEPSTFMRDRIIDIKQSAAKQTNTAYFAPAS